MNEDGQAERTNGDAWDAFQSNLMVRVSGGARLPLCAKDSHTTWKEEEASG